MNPPLSCLWVQLIWPAEAPTAAGTTCPTFTKVCHQVNERVSAFLNCAYERKGGGADLYSLRLLSLKWWSHNGHAPPMKRSWPPSHPIPMTDRGPLYPRHYCYVHVCLVVIVSGCPSPLCVLFPLATPAPDRLASVAPGEHSRGHTSKSPECHTPV